MEIYLLKSTAILAIFWMLYVLFLEKENMHHFKRFYLLASIIAAFYIPLLSITQYVYVTPIDGFEFQNEMIPFAIDDTLAPIEIPFWTLDRILLAMYLIGVTILSIRFLKNIFKMVKTITVNEKQKQSTITFVLLKQLINPHTFFNFIFLNKSKFQKNEVPEEVILHEETHAKQKHSLDILFIELLQIFFWFQPFIWFFKKRIKLNHEFLADQAVIKNGFESANYQKTLLSYSSQQDYSLSNAINYSSIKKRFTVMKTQTPQKKKWLFSLLVLPILGILFYSFSKRDLVEVNKATEDRLSLQTSIAKTTDNEASEALMSEYKSFINTFNKTKIIYGDAYERAIIIYDQLMSEAQRASVEKYPDRIIPMPNLSRIKAKSPTSEQLEAFKNPKVYAIWIDNKHVSNSELNNYAVKDFVHVSGSHVYKNARSKKFPQPNQYHLFTKAGFKTVYEDSQLNRYRKASKKYTNAISKYLKGPQNDNSELIILKIKTDAIYETFSEDDINKNNIKTTPPVPAEYITPKKSNQQKPPTAKEIADYNAWAKNVRSKFVKLSDDAVWMPPIEEKDLVKNLRIYSKMTKKQRDASEENPYPNLDPDYIEKNISASQKTKPTKQEIAEYNTWAKQMKAKFKKMPESDKVEGYPHMINDEVFRRHNAVYDRMSETQKKNAESLPEAVLVTEWPMPTVVRVNTVSNQQNPPTPKEIASYNAWAKKLNTKIESAAKGNGDYPIIKQKDIERHKSIYSRMTDKQKTDAEVFPNIPPPPPPAAPKSPKVIKTDFDVPPPPPPPVPKEAKGKLGKHHVKAYNDWIDFIKGDNPDPKYMTVKIYEYYKDMYGAFTEAQKKQTEGMPPPPPPRAPAIPQKSKSKGGPNANQQAMINYLKKIDGPDVIFTQIDAQPNKIPHYNTHLSLNEATSLIEKDSRMRLYPYNSPHSGFIVLISNNVENTIPKLTKNNRIEYIRAISSIGAKFYLDNKEIDFKKAKRILKKNPQATMASTITPPVVNIRTSLIGIKGTSIDVKSGPNPDSYNDVSTYSFVNVESYLKKYKHYEVLRNQKPHYINKSKSQQKEMDALFSDLGGMYFRLSKENKKLVERPIAPIRPYVKISLNGKTYYKKFEELTREEKETLPPPPPPIMKKNK